MFTPSARSAVQRGLRFLAGRQNPDGSFGTGGDSRNVAICSLCAMAMLAAGSTPGRGQHGGQLRKVVRFILDSCEDSGLIIDPTAASRGKMYGHGFATLFLAEVFGMSLEPELRERLSAAVQLICNTQNEAGGWRYEPQRGEADLSVTVCQVMALRAARNAGIFVPAEVIDAATGYVKRCQNEDGGFMYIDGQGGPSDFPRSAAALVALYSAGIYEGEIIEKTLTYLQQHRPGTRKASRQSYFIYGHYYAAQAMWLAGGEYWQDWYPAIRTVLGQLQQEDGSWFDSIGFEYGTAMSCLILLMPRNYLPIFRR